MDWLAEVQPGVLASQWQSIIDSSTPEAKFIWRSGAARAEFLEFTQVQRGGELYPLMSVLALDQTLAEELHEQDRVATYGSFYIANLAA
jgi:S-adenosylmethionine-diacylglycerol 3-amino-3-carboxypropyl transferase